MSGAFLSLITAVLQVPYAGPDLRLGYTALRRLMWYYKIPRNQDGSAAGRYIASESQAPWIQPRTEASTYWEVHAAKKAGLNACEQLRIVYNSLPAPSCLLSAHHVHYFDIVRLSYACVSVV